jgi:hypothetical protein
MDPCFGVRGGAGATPVSVGCAATNPTVLASGASWVTSAPSLGFPSKSALQNKSGSDRLVQGDR